MCVIVEDIHETKVMAFGAGDFSTRDEAMKIVETVKAAHPGRRVFVWGIGLNKYV